MHSTWSVCRQERGSSDRHAVWEPYSCGPRNDRFDGREFTLAPLGEYNWKIGDGAGFCAADGLRDAASRQIDIAELDAAIKQFPRIILVAKVTKMSLTYHEEIGRVRRVRRGCYEDASDFSATCRACWVVEFGERHDTWKNRPNYIHRSKAPADQSAKRVASWSDKSTDTPDIPVASSQQQVTRMSRVSGVSARMSIGNCTRGI